ncbi:hypothetical protein GCM10010326_71980 [Streptomyces xanthochromogenes]|uniref:Uncharacterized protein n=1 Tax=Streptomyces xanthochromogenes TaxID=67384 RepID=A0ABQ3AV43_9ACTN|nr:hypothetical protein GCM10010326_71980 [Streptomyces xanthochromogenes]
MQQVEPPEQHEPDGLLSEREAHSVPLDEDVEREDALLPEADPAAVGGVRQTLPAVF